MPWVRPLQTSPLFPTFHNHTYLSTFSSQSPSSSTWLISTAKEDAAKLRPFEDVPWDQFCASQSNDASTAGTATNNALMVEHLDTIDLDTEWGWFTDENDPVLIFQDMMMNKERVT
jgi:hypothetical protein